MQNWRCPVQGRMEWAFPLKNPCEHRTRVECCSNAQLEPSVTRLGTSAWKMSLVFHSPHNTFPVICSSWHFYLFHVFIFNCANADSPVSNFLEPFTAWRDVRGGGRIVHSFTYPSARYELRIKCLLNELINE